MSTRVKSTIGALILLQGCFVFGAGKAAAELTITKTDDWEIFASGRIGAFQSYVRGQAFPAATVNDADPLGGFTPQGGGVVKKSASAERAAGDLGSGRIESSRVRSGLLPNIFGLGVRREFASGTTALAYISIWSFIESPDRLKYFRVPTDVREGFIKVSGGWGSLLAGRAMTLFSRGAMEIDLLYGHGFGVGFPGSVDRNGPAFGQVGFGLVGNGFAAGLVYATPKVAGLQLSVAYYDPSALTGSDWIRTSFGRPEGELTWDIPLGNLGRIHLFGNGAWQKIYEEGTTASNTMYGAGYGGRFEVGPLRLGLAGHYGKGVGLYYAFDTSGVDEAAFGPDNRTLRTFSGYYAQSQLVLGKFDLAAGVGLTRVVLLAIDKTDTRDNDMDPATDPANDDGNPAVVDPSEFSNITQQLGVSVGITYHIRDYLAVEADYFRADYRWYQHEKQLVHFVNTGVTLRW